MTAVVDADAIFLYPLQRYGHRIASSSLDGDQTKFSFIIIMTMRDNCLTLTNEPNFGGAWD